MQPFCTQNTFVTDANCRLIETFLPLQNFKCKFISYPSVPNDCLIWKKLRQSTLLTSTELVEMSGHGYKNPSRFLENKLLGIEKTKSAFFKRILEKGRLGEIMAIERFLNVYENITINEPYFSQISFDISLVSKDARKPEKGYKDISIGASIDGVIKNEKDEPLLFLEVKTITTKIGLSEACKGFPSIEYIKLRWFIQMVVQSIIWNLDYGLFILFDFNTGEFYPYIVKFSFYVKNHYMKYLILPAILSYIATYKEIHQSLSYCGKLTANPFLIIKDCNDHLYRTTKTETSLEKWQRFFHPLPKFHGPSVLLAEEYILAGNLKGLYKEQFGCSNRYYSK